MLRFDVLLQLKLRDECLFARVDATFERFLVCVVTVVDLEITVVSETQGAQVTLERSTSSYIIQNQKHLEKTLYLI